MLKINDKDDLIWLNHHFFFNLNLFDERYLKLLTSIKNI